MKLTDYITGIQHIGIPTNDIQVTKDFYNSLGFSTELETENNGENVAFLQLKNLVIETYQNGQAAMQSGAINHIAIDVKNIDEVFCLVKSLGVEMADNSVNGLPFWENGVRFFTIVGPNKERVEFCERL
ncbi:VOC family protein [Bacteroides sp.]|uniref:VOC family protein n=1 Tax=Bacteroides sp. TaxID=29523 RepID=UPI0025C3D3C3|nr:VOC family protein [Bacteroides sp.]